MESPSAPAQVTVVIPNWNGAAWLPGCLDGLRRQEYRSFDVVLVDNGSTDGSPALARSLDPGLRVVSFPENRGFAAAANAGIDAARTEFVALLNTDTAPRAGWLGALVRALESAPPDVAGVGSMMIRMAEPTQLDGAGDFLTWTGMPVRRGYGEPVSAFAVPGDVFSVCAGAALYRRRVLEELGGFDEAFFAYLEDVDLGLRARLRGYRWLYEPSAEVLHEGHGSSLPMPSYVRLMTRNRLLLLTKSLPWPLLLWHLPRLLYGQLYFLVAYRAPLASAAGYFDYLRSLPHVGRQRREAARTRRVELRELDGQIGGIPAREPPLSRMFVRWIRRTLP
jgi:GT2 family glycosyltransferase